MIIKAFLVLFAFIIIILAATKSSIHSRRAWKKIGLIFLALLMAVAVIFPDITTDVAHLVGVGRGADLVLYLTVVAFIFYVLNNYIKAQNQRDIVFKIARKLAILEANEKYKNKISK